MQSPQGMMLGHGPSHPGPSHQMGMIGSSTGLSQHVLGMQGSHIGHDPSPHMLGMPIAGGPLSPSSMAPYMAHQQVLGSGYAPMAHQYLNPHYQPYGGTRPRPKAATKPVAKAAKAAKVPDHVMVLGQMDPHVWMWPLLQAIDRALWHEDLVLSGRRTLQDGWAALLLACDVNPGTPVQAKSKISDVNGQLLNIYDSNGRALNGLTMEEIHQRAQEKTEAMAAAGANAAASRGRPALPSSPSPHEASRVPGMSFSDAASSGQPPTTPVRRLAADSPSEVNLTPEGKPYLQKGSAMRFLARKDSGGSDDWGLVMLGNIEMLVSPAKSFAVASRAVLTGETSPYRLP